MEADGHYVEGWRYEKNGSPYSRTQWTGRRHSGNFIGSSSTLPVLELSGFGGIQQLYQPQPSSADYCVVRLWSGKPQLCKLSQKLLSPDAFCGIQNTPKSTSDGALPRTPVGKLSAIYQTLQLVGRG